MNNKNIAALLVSALVLSVLLFCGCPNGTTDLPGDDSVVTYSVIYNANGATGGSVPEDTAAYAEGDTVTVLGNTGSLIKTACTFAGWNTAADGSGTTYAAGAAFTMGTANLTLYAVWSQNTRTITFDANGGSGSMNSVTAAEGAAISLPLTTFTNDGYFIVFGGWSLTADGSAAYTDGGSLTLGSADITLYAVWSFQPAETIVHASDMAADDGFGCSISIDGDYAIVGAYMEDGGSAGLIDAGAAYIFKNTDGVWAQVGDPLHASDLEAGDIFGYSVSIDGDYAIVGACYEDGGAAGITDAGAAYIFKNTGGVWAQVGDPLHASDLEAGDAFGWSVSIDDDYAIVGASWENGGSAGLANAGAAYIFKNTGGVWAQVGDPLHASDLHNSDYFGCSVAIDGDYAIVGAYSQEDHWIYFADAGAAYIFKNTGGVWTQVDDPLQASDLEAGDWFGWSVSIDGDYAIVGACQEGGGSAGKSAAGAAYIFKNTGGVWTQVDDPLHASDLAAYDRFGYSVSIDSGCAIVGASGEDGGSAGLSSAGAAYFFE